jgi:hypothetical protein
MKKHPLTISVILQLLLMLFAVQVISFAEANPGPVTEIAPVVKVPQIEVHAVIAKVDGKIWATVDATYQMTTVYVYGNQFLTPNHGMGYRVNPSDYVTVTITYDMLDVFYPIPLNSKNISFQMDGKELNWTMSNHVVYRLFDNDLPEITWRITHVPQSFTINVHYEHPIPPAGNTSDYLGRDIFLFPLGARYGCREIIEAGYSPYPWFGNTTAKISIQIEQAFTNVTAYSVDSRGASTALDHKIARQNEKETIEFKVIGQDPSNYTGWNPYGFVVISNTPNYKIPQEQPTTTIDEETATGEASDTFVVPLEIAIATALFCLGIVGMSLAFYIRKSKQHNKTSRI